MNWCLFPQSYGNFKGNKRPIPTLEAARNWSQEAGSACLWRQFCWPHRMAQICENLWVSGRPGWHGNEGDCLYIYVYIYIMFISIHAHIIYIYAQPMYIYILIHTSLWNYDLFMRGIWESHIKSRCLLHGSCAARWYPRNRCWGPHSSNFTALL